MKLKNDFLVVDQHGSLYEEHFFRVMFAFLGNLIPTGLGLGFTFADGNFLVGIPLLLIGIFIFFGWGVFGYLWPRLHYLHGLDRDQKRAIEWYEELTDVEKAQLPKNWDKVVREAGTQKMPGQGNYPYYDNTVAANMFVEAQEVVVLYRRANTKPEMLDHRVEAHLQIMKERRQALEDTIKEEKAIEAKIKDMA